MGQTSFTYELTQDQQELILGLMVNGNFRKREVPYSLYSVEGDHFNATLYSKEKHGKRKLCIQGAKAEEFVLFQLEPLVLQTASLGYEKELHPQDFALHAGSDESGKGDYFGPLVVACTYVDEALADRMRELGVRDCKQMSDDAVLKTGSELRRLLGADGYAVVKLGPAAYNRLYAKMRNINRMLAWAHATAIEELLTKKGDIHRVVIDQFARTEATILRALKPLGKNAQIEQRHKAESDLAVAAASVIARELFLRDIRAQGEKIPIGSSDPRVREYAIEGVRREGPRWLMNHVKAHFRTTDLVLAECALDRSALPPEGQVQSKAADSQQL